MADWKTLCSELLEAAEDMTVLNDGSDARFDAVAERVRAELAQPAPLAEGEVPAAWLYKGEPDFDGANWREKWHATTSEEVARFKAQPESPIPLFRYPRRDQPSGNPDSSTTLSSQAMNQVTPVSSFTYTAKVLPLDGKYYGTIIELTDEGGCKSEIKVWIDDPDHEPSCRQLKEYGFANREEARQEGFLCDCHYESKRGFWIANLIAQAINFSPS